MAICKKCGTESNTKFCGNCGAKMQDNEDKKDKEKKKQSSSNNFADFGAFKMFSFTPDNLNEHMKNMKDFYEKNPIDQNALKSFTEGLMTQMGNMFQNAGDLNNIFQGANGNSPSEKSQSANSDNQTSRLMIINGMCPKCTNSIKKSDENCAKCGASLNLDDYK